MCILNMSLNVCIVFSGSTANREQICYCRPVLTIPVDVLPLPIPGIIGFSGLAAVSDFVSFVEKYRGDGNDEDDDNMCSDDDGSILLVLCCIEVIFNMDGLRFKRSWSCCGWEPQARVAVRHRGVVNRTLKLMVNMYTYKSSEVEEKRYIHNDGNIKNTQSGPSDIHAHQTIGVISSLCCLRFSVCRLHLYLRRSPLFRIEERIVDGKTPSEE
jgi:hypothetical protein